MRKLFLLALILLVTISSCQSVQVAKTGPVTIDPEDLQEFADSFFYKQLNKQHIPGAVFVFVQGDQVIYAKGYGYANLERKIPTDSANTVVRIGSISKSFVATAVMQLVEQGKLDLHTDVNQYLTAFKLEDTYPEPVTLAHLLTHTAGFEDPPYATSTDYTSIQPLRDYLATNMPPRTHAPGEAYIYCSHGIDLAALIVEEVSGVPFTEYLEQNILKPLGMLHTQYLLAPPMPENLATGYFYTRVGFLRKNVQVPLPIDYDNSYPSGSIVSTASDMTHFLTVQLQDGCYDGVCILRPETIAQMHKEQLATSREGQNSTLGFVEWALAGQRLVGHSGAIKGFGAIFEFFPDHGFGYFIAFNEECWQTSACTIIAEFRNQLAERFLFDS